MGVTIGTYLDNGPAGWTTFTASASTQIVYVSSSLGNDTTGIIGDVNHPYQTLSKGMSLLRAGFPDWLLLKKGDTWTNEVFGQIKVYGLSATEPMVIGSYDPASPGVVNPVSSLSRPLLQTQFDGVNPAVLWAHSSGGGSLGGNYFAVTGLEFYSYRRDPNNGSFNSAANNTDNVTSWLNLYNWLLWEDNKFSFYGGVGFGNGAGGILSSGLIFRRNVIVDAWQLRSNGRAQGVAVWNSFAPVIEENVFDHNGWNETLTALTSVSISQGSPAVVTWSSNKIPQTDTNQEVFFASTGGGITANTKYYVFSNNGTTFNISTTPTTPTLVNTSAGLVSPQNIMWNGAGKNDGSHNMYLGGYPSGSEPDGGPYGSGQIVLRGNISAEAATFGSECRDGGIVTNNLFIENSAALWTGNTHGGTTSVYSNVITESEDYGPNNDLFQYLGWGIQLFTSYDNVSGANAGAITAYSNLIIHSASSNGTQNGQGIQIGANASDHTPIGVSVTNNIIADWLTNTGQGINDYGTNSTVALNTYVSGSDLSGHGWPDPTRRVETYDSLYLGGPGTTAHFLTLARGQSKSTWNSDLTATAVNTYIFAGFGIGGTTINRRHKHIAVQM